MKIYLQTKGAFEAKVKDSLTLVKKWYAPWATYKKRRNIIYTIEIPHRYKINEFSIYSNDSIIKKEISSVKGLEKIKKGDYYDEEVFCMINYRL